jgi:hypothetical protein
LRTTGSSLLRRVIIIVSLIGFMATAFNSWAAGSASSSFPTVADFPGWIALFQPEGQLASYAQTTLRVRPLVPGGPGVGPRIEVTVTACGQGRFDGELLLAGDAGVVDPGSVFPSGVHLDTLHAATLEDSSFGVSVDLSGVRRVRFGGVIEQVCVPGGQVGQVLVQFVARLGHPTLLRKRSLWFESARQVQSWPMLGAVPAFNIQSLGEFSGTGDLAGAWTRPRSLNVDLGIGTLGATVLVDSSSPPLTASDNAHWQQTTPFRAKLSLVDQRSIAGLQNWLSVSGILLGVFASIVAALLLEIGLGSGAMARSDPPNDAVAQPPPGRGGWTLAALGVLAILVLRGTRRTRWPAPKAHSRRRATEDTMR